MPAMMRRLFCASVAATAAALFFSPAVRTQSAPKCDPDNGGLMLPSGFCALVVAERALKADVIDIAERHEAVPRR